MSLLQDAVNETLAADLRGLDHSITLFDRAYFSSAFLLDWQRAGTQRHWLMRAKDNLRHEVVQTLIAASSARSNDPLAVSTQQKNASQA